MNGPIEKYIDRFPPATQRQLNAVLNCIRKAAPGTEEVIGYGIPTFKLNGKNLVHFAGYKNHIGFYPAPKGISEFKKELAGYKPSKGAVQFPVNQPMPLALIRKIVRFRVEQEKQQEPGFMDQLSKPAQRALQGHNIRTLKQIARFKEEELLKLHGFGPTAIVKLRIALKREGLAFKK